MKELHQLVDPHQKRVHYQQHPDHSDYIEKEMKASRAFGLYITPKCGDIGRCPPMITPVDSIKVINPALTKLTTMTVVVVED